MSLQLSELSLQAIGRAQNLAVEHGSATLNEAHFFLALLELEVQGESANSLFSDGVILILLALSGVSREEARLYAQSAIENDSPKPAKEPELSRGAKQVLELGAHEARLDHSPLIEPQHLFIACVSHRRGPHLGEVLRPLGLDAAQLRQHLRGLKGNERPYAAGNPLNDLTEGAKRTIEAAQAEMRASFCGRIATSHLLLGLLSDEETAATLENAGCDLEDLRKRARDSIKSDGEIAMPQKRFSPGAKRALERAAREAKLAGNKFIGRGQILLGLLPQRQTLGEKWKARGRNLDSLDFLWTEAQVEALRGELGSVVNDKDTSDARSSNRGLTATQVLFLIVIGSAAGFFWAIGLYTPNPYRSSTLYFHTFLWRLMCYILPPYFAALFFGRSEQSKQAAFISTFISWVLSAVIAVYSFVGL